MMKYKATDSTRDAIGRNILWNLHSLIMKKTPIQASTLLRKSSFIAFFAAVLGLAASLQAVAPVNPDLTTEQGRLDVLANKKVKVMNLGPTGLRGWLYPHQDDTSESRQILITAVNTGSPASGSSKKVSGTFNWSALDAKPGNGKSVTPTSQPDERHQQAYLQLRKEHQEAPRADLVFLGDSITWCWRTPPGEVVWKEYYAHRNVLNFGVGGAKTENVIWQIQNGFADGYQAKLMVLMVGTNNSKRDGPAEIAAGIRRILIEWFQRQPRSKVLLLGIFPRGETPADPRRQICEKANELIRKLHDDRRVFYLNINDGFLDEKGTLSRDIMPDLLHPESEEGYRIWAEGIEPLVSKTLGNKKPPLPKPKTIDRLEIGKMPADSRLRIKLPLTIALPPGKQGAFLFTDRMIVETDSRDSLLLMNSSAVTWDQNEGSVGHLEYHGLEKGRHWGRVHWTELGLNKDQQRQIVKTGERNNVGRPDAVFKFGTYWIDKGSKEARITDVEGREKVRYLYTFEMLEKGKLVTAVKRRRYHVTVAAPE
jgi:lysophospholipase L1-like esterase